MDRVATVERIHERIATIVERELSVRDCVAVALSCTLIKNREEVVSFLLNRIDARKVSNNFEKAVLTSEEWATLYGKGAAATNNAAFDSLVKDCVFLKTKETLESAMRCTLDERACQECWERPLSVAACQLAIHTGNAEDWITTSLGGFVRGDSRRLDDVVCEMEDTNFNTMVLAETALSLASAVSH